MNAEEIFFTRKKAAFLPYYYHDEQLYLLVVMSSNPAFGGDRYMLCKGAVDPGEDYRQTAIREAQEEIGLKLTNLNMASVQEAYTSEEKFIDGRHYILKIFIGEVKDASDFGPTDYEIADRKWMTPEEFYKIGRRDHIPLVKACVAKISNKQHVSESIQKNITYDNRRLPNAEELKLEFEIKQKKPNYIKSFRNNYGINIFDDWDRFMKAIKAGHVERLPFNKYTSVDRVSTLNSIEDIKAMTASYAYPRDPDRIYNGFLNNDSIPMPIIIDYKVGRVIIAGNTRLGVAYAAKINPAPKVLIIPGEVK